ncbi:DUF2948 family protein [Xanthobacter dioxanivorans]|uniref:DUF2948 family protein n=1 Tax=Xanthobacter dioxanivorans TaxID=2528964 RepID=A0A974PND9_9HYPH|nr:DUF2948 family protein [Xanthobacter dioxanivorans]QRG06379.1 DUF2948 family protein [Xanthobacter dioxanivorans]
MENLKLIALDEEDLAIVSAHLQDAVVKMEDMGFLPRLQRFAMVLNRFDWDQKVCANETVRRRTGLHFERVLEAKCRGMDEARRTGVLNLLAVTFLPGEAPSGHVLLTFSGGAEVRLHVECIEAGFRDLGPAWGCTHAPKHPLPEDPAADKGTAA